MGEPNPEFCDSHGQILVPYLSPSWREIMLVNILSRLEFEDQARTIYALLARRLPDLSFEEFLDLASPDDFPTWWTATRPPPIEGEGGQGKPIGQVSSRRLPWRSLLFAG